MEIVIPLFDRFTALDAVGPYEVLSRIPEARVVFAAQEQGVFQTENGMLALRVDRALADVPAPDVIVFPGGFGTRALMEDAATLKWLRTAHASSIWTTSVCTGSLVLAAAGLLNGLCATTHWLQRDILSSMGAVVVEERVVVEGKIVTAAGVSAGIDMALMLAARIAGDEVAQAIQLGIEYDPAPPFDVGSRSKAPEALLELVSRRRDEFA